MTSPRLKDYITGRKFIVDSIRMYNALYKSEIEQLLVRALEAKYSNHNRNFVAMVNDQVYIPNSLFEKLCANEKERLNGYLSKVQDLYKALVQYDIDNSNMRNEFINRNIDKSELSTTKTNVLNYKELKREFIERNYTVTETVFYGKIIMKAC